MEREGEVGSMCVESCLYHLLAALFFIYSFFITPFCARISRHERLD
jgi:hypothetical protein